MLLAGGARTSLRQPGGLLFSIVGIALATALVVGVDLANAAARRGYEESFARLGNGVSHRIEAVDGRLSDADYVALRAAWRAGGLPAVRDMAPMLVASVELRAAPAAAATHHPSLDAPDDAPDDPADEPADGIAEVRELWGVDALRTPAPRAGGADAAAPAPPPASGVAVAAGARLLTGDAVLARGLRPGRWWMRVAPLRYANTAAPWRAVDVIASPNPGAQGDLLIADIATAQSVLGRPGVLSHIDVLLDCAAGAPGGAGGPAGTDWLDRLFPGLGATAAVGCAAERSLHLPARLRLRALSAQRDEDLSAAAAFEFNLGALSLLAAAVAAFLVHQVVVLGAHRQTIENGRLRALGMTGVEVGARLVFGYVGIAFVAGLAGVLLGELLARALVQRVSAVVNDLFYRVAVTGVQLDGVAAAKGMAVAVGVALLASIGPALRLARTPPVQLVNGELRARARSGGAWFGVSCLVAAAVLLRFTDATWAALLAIALCLLSSLGLAGRLLSMLGLAGRALPGVWRAQRSPARLAVVPRLALADLERTGRDASLALGALVVAVATAFGMAWMIDSFRGALTDVLTSRLSADLFVRVEPADAARLDALVGLPGVRSLARAARDDVQVGGLRTALRVVDRPDLEARRIDVPAAALAAGQVALSEPLAHRLRTHMRVEVGAPLRVGRCVLRVGGIFKEYGAVQGRLTAARAVLAPCLVLPPATEAEVQGTLTVAQALRALAGARAPMVARPDAIRAVSLQIFDRTFAVTQVVRWLALLVAAIALFASLSVWVSQRAAELGVLRALGLTGGELGRMLALQTLVLGALAILLALPLGAAIAWILTAELHPRAFGWSFPLRLAWAPIADTLVVAVLAVLAGAALPVSTLARAPAMRWLRQARHG